MSQNQANLRFKLNLVWIIKFGKITTLIYSDDLNWKHPSSRHLHIRVATCTRGENLGWGYIEAVTQGEKRRSLHSGHLSINSTPWCSFCKWLVRTYKNGLQLTLINMLWTLTSCQRMTHSAPMTWLVASLSLDSIAQYKYCVIILGWYGYNCEYESYWKR